MPNKFAIGDKVLIKRVDSRTPQPLLKSLRLDHPRTIVATFYDNKAQHTRYYLGTNNRGTVDLSATHFRSSQLNLWIKGAIGRPKKKRWQRRKQQTPLTIEELPTHSPKPQATQPIRNCQQHTPNLLLSKQREGHKPNKQSLKITTQMSLCPICKTREALSIHHITPFSQGGKDIERNRIIVCKTCHDMLEDYAERGIPYSPALVKRLQVDYMG